MFFANSAAGSRDRLGIRWPLLGFWLVEIFHGNRRGTILVAEEVLVTVTVKVDAQGRVVIPQAERERLDLTEGGALELVPTPEGVLLERRRRATVTSGEDGLPLVTLDDDHTVSNAEATKALHTQRDEQ
jgi:AbrB family looped-hinge helix DNA binding protein